MKLVTAEQMREIDRISIHERGIPGIDLMRRAGIAVAEAAIDFFQPESVAILTGKGNNAGDGFVAAQWLHARGVAVGVFALEDPDNLKGDAAQAYAEFAAAVLRGEPPSGTEQAECRPREYVSPSLVFMERNLPEYDLVIDAMFGTGLTGPLAAPWADAVELLNRLKLPVLAVDIPSGLPAAPLTHEEADTRAIVRATRTITIGRPKVGMLVGAGMAYTGEVTVEEIQFPTDLLEAPAISINLMTETDARHLLPARNPHGHKGTFGRVLVIGGSAGMTGAGVLAARAATRSGAGLVYVAYPEPLSLIFETHLIEPVKWPLPGDARWFTAAHLPLLLERMGEIDAVALGPGVGQHPATAEFVHGLLPHLKVPVVIDADGLNLVSGKLDVLNAVAGRVILTPHPGEAARLLGRPGIAAVEADRLGAFAEFARQHAATTVLKGAQTITTSPDGERWVNPTGNSGLAKGGSGDVLTGLIAGLLAQGLAVADAARLGVFVHGLAADLAAERLGSRAMLPSDVIEHFGPAFARLEQAR